MILQLTPHTPCRVMGLCIRTEQAKLALTLQEQGLDLEGWAVTPVSALGSDLCALVMTVAADHKPTLQEIAATNQHLLALMLEARFMPLRYSDVMSIEAMNARFANTDAATIKGAVDRIAGHFELGINYYFTGPEKPESLALDQTYQSRDYLRELKAERDDLAARRKAFSKRFSTICNWSENGISAVTKLPLRKENLLFRAGVLVDRHTFDQSQLHSTLLSVDSSGEVALQITGPFVPLSFVPGLKDL